MISMYYKAGKINRTGGTNDTEAGYRAGLVAVIGDQSQKKK